MADRGDTIPGRRTAVPGKDAQESSSEGAGGLF